MPDVHKTKHYWFMYLPMYRKVLFVGVMKHDPYKVTHVTSPQACLWQ